jgi:hypothetical protein
VTRAALCAGRGTVFPPRAARRAARGDARPPAHDQARGAPGGTSVACPGGGYAATRARCPCYVARRKSGVRLAPFGGSRRSALLCCAVDKARGGSPKKPWRSRRLGGSPKPEPCSPKNLCTLCGSKNPSSAFTLAADPRLATCDLRSVAPRSQILGTLCDDNGTGI